MEREEHGFLPLAQRILLKAAEAVVLRSNEVHIL